MPEGLSQLAEEEIGSAELREIPEFPVGETRPSDEPITPEEDTQGTFSEKLHLTEDGHIVNEQGTDYTELAEKGAASNAEVKGDFSSATSIGAQDQLARQREFIEKCKQGGNFEMVMSACQMPEKDGSIMEARAVWEFRDGQIFNREDKIPIEVKIDPEDEGSAEDLNNLFSEVVDATATTPTNPDDGSGDSDPPTNDGGLAFGQSEGALEDAGVGEGEAQEAYEAVSISGVVAETAEMGSATIDIGKTETEVVESVADPISETVTLPLSEPQMFEVDMQAPQAAIDAVSVQAVEKAPAAPVEVAPAVLVDKIVPIISDLSPDEPPTVAIDNEPSRQDIVDAPEMVADPIAETITLPLSEPQTFEVDIQAPQSLIDAVSAQNVERAPVQVVDEVKDSAVVEVAPVVPIAPPDEPPVAVVDVKDAIDESEKPIARDESGEDTEEVKSDAGANAQKDADPTIVIPEPRTSEIKAPEAIFVREKNGIQLMKLTKEGLKAREERSKVPAAVEQKIFRPVPAPAGVKPNPEKDAAEIIKKTANGVTLTMPRLFRPAARIAA